VERDAEREVVEAVESLIDETRLLFHRLKLAGDRLHDSEGITAGMRGVLYDVARRGPQTVPQLARSRPVSRQHIQMLVNPLAERRFVELVDNPAHRRSRLVRLTGKGRRLVDRMRRREKRVLSLLGEGLTESRLRSATTTMRVLRRRLAEEASQDGDARAD
jgi:DNA-binding MarR family transcriptional regulator